MSFYLKAQNSDEFRIYNHIYWGVILQILHEKASDILSKQEFTDLSFNHGKILPGDKTIKIGMILKESSKEYKATPGELPIEISGAIMAVERKLSNDKFVCNSSNDIIWTKEEIDDLADFLIRSGGIYVG